jgi:hypothetical protein
MVWRAPAPVNLGQDPTNGRRRSAMARPIRPIATVERL